MHRVPTRLPGYSFPLAYGSLNRATAEKSWTLTLLILCFSATSALADSPPRGPLVPSIQIPSNANIQKISLLEPSS